MLSSEIEKNCASGLSGVRTVVQRNVAIVSRPPGFVNGSLLSANRLFSAATEEQRGEREADAE